MIPAIAPRPPFIPDGLPVSGHIYDVHTGQLEMIVTADTSPLQLCREVLDGGGHEGLERDRLGV